MKPCLSKRKLIAWQALGQLDARQAQDLLAHIKTCNGCRQYLEEMSAVGERLLGAEPEPEIEPSAFFHQRLVGRLRAERSGSRWEMLFARLNWRVALPAAGLAALVILMLSLFPRQPGVAPPVQISRPAVAPPAPKGDLSPTVANYQRAASRSLDDLDDLLTRQANRKRAPAPLYTASIFALAQVPD
jgi:hypothetical protein